MNKKIRHHPITEEKLRLNLMSAIMDYDSEIEYINDPKNNRSESNKSFMRNVLIDHVLMIMDYYLESNGQNGITSKEITQ